MFLQGIILGKQLESLQSRIIEKKQRIDSHRPLSAMAARRVADELSLEWTYNSNGIEGNSLTLAETRIVLQDGMTIGGKSLREHFEVINHNRAIQFLESLVDHKTLLRSIDVLNIHELVMHGIDEDFAGRLRNGMVRIVGANFTPPGPEKISILLDELIDFANSNPLHLDKVILSAVFHHRLVWIHPFFDGNGRTARLVMNLLLMQAGFPPAIILKNDRKKYYDALVHANKGDYNKIILLVMQSVERSLNMYLQIIPTAYEEFKPISEVAQDPELPYGMEYISLLARTGKIDAYKEGRNWLTSRNSVLNYINNRKVIE